MYINVSGTWRSATNIFINVSGTWRSATNGYINVAGTWRRFFASALTPSIAATVEISRNNATYPSTLTGTNYSWTNSTSLTYVFEKSSDNSNFVPIGSAAVINNPSSGSSNTVTYALTLPDFPAFTSYYRFAVTAVNSTYSTSFTSTSGSVSVSRPAPINTVAPTISPSSGTVGVTEYSVTSNGTWDPVDADGVYQYLWQSYDTPTYISAPGTNTLSTYTPPSNFLSLGYQSPIRCRVTAVNASGSTAAFSSNTATVLGVALTPTFGANTSTAGGFTGSVTNYSASYTWGISTNSGSVSFGTPSGSTYPFTVTGLSSSASATVTVTTSRSGYNSGSAQTTGTANAAPSPPTINSFSATTTSITLNFTLGANSTSTRAYLNGGFDGSTAGTSYTFAGLQPGTAYTLALFGYNGVVQSATSSGGSYSTSTGAALTPTFGANTSVSGGFTGSVTNYSASYTWGISTNSGSVSFGSPSGSTYPFTVSGLGSGASATVTVTTSRTGYAGGSAQTTGTATTQVPVNTVAPTITPTSGTAGTTTYSVNSVGSWTNSPTSYGYQWQYNDGGSTYLSISGATSSSYSPPSNFFSGLFYASPIRCRVTASNAGGPGTAAFSNTATVAAPAVAPSGGTVSISTNTGNYVVGSVITFSTSGWSGSPTSYSLRLYNGTNPVLTSDPQRGSTINGTSGTYTIQSIDVPYYFKAFATASNSAGTSTEASSTQVGPAVAAAGAVPVLISLTGDNSLALGGTFSWSFSNSPTAYSLFVTGPSGTVYTTSNAYTYNSTTFRPGYDGTGWQGAGTYTIYVSAQNTTGNSLVASLSTSMN